MSTYSSNGLSFNAAVGEIEESVTHATLGTAGGIAAGYTYMAMNTTKDPMVYAIIGATTLAPHFLGMGSQIQMLAPAAGVVAPLLYLNGGGIPDVRSVAILGIAGVAGHMLGQMFYAA